MSHPIVWRFLPDSRMDISSPAGMHRGAQYRLYPDGNGRWFLAVPGRIHWIDVGENTIAVEQNLVAGEEGFETAFVLRKN